MSQKPQPREQVNEVERTAWVRQGRNLATPSSSSDRTVTVRVVLVRLPEDMLAEVDGLLKQRRVKVSRNTWFLEALVEKIQREQG